MAKKPVCDSCGVYTDCYCPDCRSENYDKRLEEIERLLEIIIENQHKYKQHRALKHSDSEEGK